MSSLIRKISAKSVCGKIEKPKKAEKLFSVIGIANKTKTGQSDYGPWTALVGQFEATNYESGEIFVAPQCFLPEPLNSMLAGTLEETDEEGKQVTASVQFAVEVGVKPSDVPIGYEYTTKELVEADTADPLAALRDSAAKALPAPAKKGNGKKS